MSKTKTETQDLQDLLEVRVWDGLWPTKRPKKSWQAWHGSCIQHTGSCTQ